VALPVAGSIRHSRPAFVWTASSVAPPGVATMPLRLLPVWDRGQLDGPEAAQPAIDEEDGVAP
jgi:hypothetical protein